MKLRLFLAVCIFQFAASLPAQDSADWRGWVNGERFKIGAAFFQPSLDTTVVVTDATGTVGTGISFEQNLGLDDNDGTGLLEFTWRFAKRHDVSYNFFNLDRSSITDSSSTTIAVGEEVFDITLPIRSFFDITVHEVAYSYSLIFDQRKNLSVGIGLSVQDLELGLQGTASSPNPGAIINSNLDSTAPLPTLNIGFDYAFTDKWIFESQLGWLAVDLDFAADESLSGQIINGSVGVRWNTFKNVGFFAQYRLFDVDVDYDVNDVIFALDYDYMGPALGVSARF